MSRIGKLPIELPSGVKATIADRTVTVQGKGGTLTFEHRPEVTVKVEDNQIVVERVNDSKKAKAMHGTTRSVLANMVVGVSDGFKRELEINGVGWTARVQGRTVALNLGYADTREVPIPNGVDVEVQGNRIIVSGTDKQQVGQVAAACRAHRKPEPYNHKGVKYTDEVLIKKEGKAFAGGGG